MNRPPRSLVVEDSSSMRQLLQQMLEERGHEVESVANAERALEAFACSTHDLLLVDWTLPKLSGLELTRAIRDRPDGQDVYILVVTGRNTPDDVKRVLDAGASDYVAKPVDSHVLSTRLAIAERQVRAQVAQRRMREQLIVSDRMASVGTLAAGVAHELNNPLAFVLSNLELIRGELQTDVDEASRQRLIDQVGESIEGARRMAAIVRDLHTFSFASEDPAEKLSPPDVVRAALHLSWNELRHRGRINEKLEPVPDVLAPRGALAQLVLNLLLHAAQGIDESDPDRHITIRTRTTDAGLAEIAVGRSGPAIPAESLPNLFDPFFTTRESTERTGLGLAVCRNLVLQLDGTLEVESSDEAGTWFTVRLPPAPADGPSGTGRLVSLSQPPVSPRSGRADRAHVVIIDDEPLLSRSLARILRKHHVTVFSRGADAMEFFASTEPRSIDLILCDLMMPEMSGMQVYDALANMRPRLAERVVFMTGGAFTPKAASFVRKSGRRVLDKPFDLAKVRSLVDEVIAGEETDPESSA